MAAPLTDYDLDRRLRTPGMEFADYDRTQRMRMLRALLESDGYRLFLKPKFNEQVMAAEKSIRTVPDDELVQARARLLAVEAMVKLAENSLSTLQAECELDMKNHDRSTA